MPVFVITARPMYDQPYEGCLDRPEVAAAVMMLSEPGVLNVTLRPGTTAAAAGEIASCLRDLPGEPLTVEVSEAETQ